MTVKKKNDSRKKKKKKKTGRELVIFHSFHFNIIKKNKNKTLKEFLHGIKFLKVPAIAMKKKTKQKKASASKYSYN